MTYAEETDIEALFGWNIDDIGISRPTTTQLAKMLSVADSIINAEARVTSNLADSSGNLKAIACSLVQKMIINLMAFSDPKQYGFIEPELTDNQKRIIHIEHGVWQAYTFDVGG